VSVAPPGWVEPRVAVTPGSAPPAPRDGDLRHENRRLLDSRRLGARVLDWLILAPPAGLVIWEWGWQLGTFALVRCLLLIYDHCFEVTRGATPGKRHFGLRVAQLDDGELPTPRQAAGRGVIGIFETGLIAGIAIIATKQRRRLGDLAAGTAVVDARVHPIASRPLFARALVYPVIWAVPAVLACAAGARGDLHDTYRYKADQWCVGYAQAVVRSVNRTQIERTRPLDVAGFDAVFLAHLEALHPPHAWHARADDLLARMRAQAAMHVRIAASGTGIDALMARMNADDAALAAEGFRGCAGIF
jgi:uncharacterized RDD family membrane protein YckC